MRSTVFDKVATIKTLEVIQTLKMEDRILLSSFNHQYIREVKELAPEIDSAALQEDAHSSDLIGYLRALGVTCYHPQKEITTQSLVAELNAAGIIVNVFTVNDPHEKEKLYSWGVKSVFTDFLL